MGNIRKNDFMRNKRDKKQRSHRFKEATPLCPNCLKEVDPNAYYCPYCNSPSAINPNATYMPYNNIKFENEPITSIFPIYGILVLLTFCILCTWLSLVIFPLCVRWIIINPRLHTKLNFILLALTGTIIAIIIVVKIIQGDFFDPFI